MEKSTMDSTFDSASLNLLIIADLSNGLGVKTHEAAPTRQ